MKIIYVHGANASPLSFNYIANKLPYDQEYFTYSTEVPLLENAEKLKTQIGTEPCAVVGHSLGGVLSVLAAHDLPNVLAIVSLCSPHGGSAVADVFKLFSSQQIFRDINKNSPAVKHISSLTQIDKLLNIVSWTPHSIFRLSEKSDGVVTLKSQKSVNCPNVVEITGNHFEVLLNPEVVKSIEEFIKNQNTAFLSTTS